MPPWSGLGIRAASSHNPPPWLPQPDAALFCCATVCRRHLGAAGKTGVGGCSTNWAAAEGGSVASATITLYYRQDMRWHSSKASGALGQTVR